MSYIKRFIEDMSEDGIINEDSIEEAQKVLTKNKMN